MPNAGAALAQAGLLLAAGGQGAADQPLASVEVLDLRAGGGWATLGWPALPRPRAWSSL